MITLNQNTYRIITEPNEADSGIITPPELESELEELYIKASKGKPSVKGRLEKLIKRYPNLPFLRNFLAKWYEVNNQPDAATKINDEILTLFPDYIFAIAYKAGKLLKQEDITGVESLLAGRLDITSFYPGRKSFHISEYRSCISLAVNYLAMTGRFEEAEERIKLLENADYENNVTTTLQSLVMTQRLMQGARHMKAHAEDEIYAVEREQCTLPQRELLMKPLATAFEYLYGAQFEIDEALLRDSMEHNKDALKKELKHILRTGIEGYDFIASRAEDNEEWPAAVMHAMLILPYLDDEDSFADVLEVLRQPEELIEFWIGDWKSDLITPYFRHFTEAKLQQILNFVKEPGTNSSAKNALLEFLPSFTLNDKESEKSIIRALKTLLEYFIEQRNDATLFDTGVIAFAAGAAMDLKATELIDTITTLYENKWISVSVNGTLEDAKELMRNEENGIRTKFYPDVFTHLHDMKRVNERNNTPDNEANSYPDDLPRPNKANDTHTLPVAPVKTNIFANASKNAPCPCGSGKKYKRCHGNNE